MFRSNEFPPKRPWYTRWPLIRRVYQEGHKAGQYSAPILLDEMDAEYVIIQRFWQQWILRRLDDTDTWGTFASLPVLVTDGPECPVYEIYDRSGAFPRGPVGSRRIGVRILPEDSVRVSDFRLNLRREEAGPPPPQSSKRFAHMGWKVEIIPPPPPFEDLWKSRKEVLKRRVGQIEDYEKI